MNIFNKKKEKKLEEEIKLLKNELKIKDELLKQPKDTSYEEYLSKENQKLINWIENILKEFGVYEVKERSLSIPIYKPSNFRAYDNPNELMTIKRKQIVIPEIIINKCVEEIYKVGE